MKLKKRFLLLFLISINILPAYNQGWVVSNVIKGSTIDPQYSVIDNQNNLYVLASFNDTIYSPYSIIAYGTPKDVFLFKFNSSGNVLWYNRIGSTALETAAGISLDGSNNCYVTGSYYGTCRFSSTDSLLNTGNSDIFLAKYNANGVFQWAKRVGASTTLQSSIDLKYDGNNHLMMAGFFKDSLIIGNNSSDKDTLFGNSVVCTFIAQFDLSGNHVWSKRFLGTNGSTRIRRIDISQNGYYFGGYFQGDMIFDIGTISSYQATTFDAFIYKTDFNGTGEWVRRIRGQNTENFKSLTTDEYDNVYILGNYNSSTIYADSTATDIKTYSGNSGGYDTFIGKYNRSGILQWFIRKGSTSKDVYNDFVVRNNLIYATGYFANQIIFNVDTLRSSSTSNEDAFVAAFNEIGDPISGVSMVGTGNYDDAGTIVNMDANSRAYVSGYYKSQQIKIGESIYTSSNVNKSDLFFAIYKQPFQAVITDETEVSCYGLSDGMLQVTPYFGTPPYTYKWSHDASLNSSKATNLPAGSYTVTIYGSGGIDSAYTVGTITQPASLNISDTITNVSCYNSNNGSIDITVTGGTIETDYIYNWTSPNGSGLHPLKADQDSLSHGTYYLTVKDDNLCSLFDTTFVLQPDPIRFDSTQVTDVIKPPGGNGAINLEVTGGTLPYGYAWEGPSGYSSAAEDIDNLNGGLYSIVITDKNSCQNDSSFVVNDIDILIAQVTAVTDLTCFGSNDGTATITVHNAILPLDYMWSDGASFIDVSDTVHFRSNLAPGLYTVTITDAVAKSAVVNPEINDPATPLNIILDPTDLKCNGDNSGSVDLIVSGGTLPYTFLWNTGYTGEDLVNIAAGTYFTTVTDAKGCIETGNAVVIQPTAISLGILTRPIPYIVME